MRQPDILIFMSDQHGSDYSQWGRVKVDTPVLNSMRENGTSFANAYTARPLCVPARMSMMSSLLPSKTGIFDNNYTLPDLTPCFTHSLVEAGYETVLIGRMHFIGKDQRHGFTKRLAADITPTTWNKDFKELMKERGRAVRAFGSECARDLVGAGVSMVSEYDEMVIKSSLKYLNEDHEKPQFILVGTFGPHCPYITSKAMFEKYMSRLEGPNYFESNTLPDYMDHQSLLKARMKGNEVTPEIAKASLAAYCGQIEIMDKEIGKVRDAFISYAARNNNKAMVTYLIMEIPWENDEFMENRRFSISLRKSH